MSNNNDNPPSGYHPTTVVLMADGTSRLITDLVAGDLLMGVTGSPVRLTESVRIDNRGTQERPPVQLYRLSLALNNEPLILTINQLVFVRNNFQPIVQYAQEQGRSDSYRVYHFNGNKVEGKRFKITPQRTVYNSEDEARAVAEQWSDTQIRSRQDQTRYTAIRQRMYLVDEYANHFTFGGQTVRPIRYFYWPRNADTGRKRNFDTFDTRELALNAAQQASEEHVFSKLPSSSGDPLRPGFFHNPDVGSFWVRFIDPQGELVLERFHYEEGRPSYENPTDARLAANNFAEGIRESTTIPRPGQTFRMELRSLINMGNANRECFPLVFSPGLDFRAREVPLDPYYLGVWLGDGNRNDTGIAQGTGPEVAQWLQEYAQFLRMRLTSTPPQNPTMHHIVNRRNYIPDLSYVPRSNERNFVYTPDIGNNYQANKLYNQLLALNVTRRGISGTGSGTDLKHIPNIFKFNSRDVRLKVLAGLIDTDGSYSRPRNGFSFSQSVEWHTRLFTDLLFVARSLGLYCARPTRAFYEGSAALNLQGRFFEQWRTQIFGDIEEVPCQIARNHPRRRIDRHSHRQLSVRTYSVVSQDDAQEYYTIHTEDNQPFLRADFLVLLPSRNRLSTLEEEMSDRSYQELLVAEEVLPGEDVDMGAGIPSYMQAFGAIKYSTLGEDEKLDLEEEQENLTELIEGYEEEFGEDAYDEEAALAIAIQESRETAARADIASLRIAGESPTAGPSTSQGEPSSSTAAPSTPPTTTGDVPPLRQATRSRKGKEREETIIPDPKRRRRE